MSESQADQIRKQIGEVLEFARSRGAVTVVFRAENVSHATVGTATNHPNVISALTSDKMAVQTGFSPGTLDRDYKSSAALITFDL